MKKILKVFVALGALCTLMTISSCQKGEDIPLSKEMNFDFSIPSGVTKVASGVFETGDAISLFGVKYTGDTPTPVQISGNFLNNERMVLGGSGWSSGRPLYWGEEADAKYDFYALYPYQELVSVEEHPFQVAVDQNSQGDENTLGGYEATDILYAKVQGMSRPDDNSVSMTFKHLMTKCVVNLVKGDKFEGNIPSDAVAHIYNTITSGTIDLSAGSIGIDPQGRRETITMKKVSDTQFEALLIPQNIERKTPLFEITMGGIAYLLEYSISLRPSYVHTINLILNTSPDQEKIEISIDPGISDFN